MTAALDQVVQVLDTAALGRVATLHLHGPRGVGKTWWLRRVEAMAAERGMRVLRAHGSPEDRELPFAALSALLASVRGPLADPAWAALHPVTAFDHRGADSFEVKVAAFEFLCTLAGERPVCVVVDDVHLVDAASLDVLAFVFRRADADALACVTASTEPDNPTQAPVTRLDALPTAEVARLVQERGVVPGVARQCAEAAHGNPGLAMALADGLSDEQRAGAAPVAVLPRPAGGLADELQRRLREHGECVCRALVVAAAEHGGDLAAVRAALAVLGEPLAGLEDAEAAGVVQIVGTRLVFGDPWTRAAAYHLVAPASRRAAHRALAASFDEPGQAAERAWHLAAGADGPSDAVADALALLATDTARRGGPASAALTAERAAEFAEKAIARRRHLLAALGWWLDAADPQGVSRVARQLDAADDECAAAHAEAEAFLRGDDGPAGEATGDAGPWTRRRERRRRLAAAADCGDHRAVLREFDQRALDRGAGDDLLAAAAAHRHAGRVREARDLVIRALAVLVDLAAAPAVAAVLADIDLDLLQGRADDALDAIERVRGALPAGWDDRLSLLHGRALLLTDPERAASATPDAFVPVGAGPLLTVRELVRAGVLQGDPSALREAVALADGQALPLEAGEARLWLAAALPLPERVDALTRAQATLQRCGARGWDTRLAALARSTAGPLVERPRDPAIDALSQAELRVADAVARGLTNREAAATLLISVKTVDFHLQQIYRKIGVRSRTELAVRMAGHGPTATGERR